MRIDLNIECDSIDKVDFFNSLYVKVCDVKNINEIVEYLAQTVPSLLVDALGVEYVKQYFNLHESGEKNG